MARRRSIDPDFFTDEEILDMDPACRLFYIATWTVAEDSGVLSLGVKSLSRRTGLDLKETEKYLQYLIDSNKIIVFKDGFGWIKNFFKYQKVPKPSPPKLPLPKWIKFTNNEKAHLRAYKNSGKIPGIVQDDSYTIPTEVKLSKVKLSKENKYPLSGKEPDDVVSEVLEYLNLKANRSFTATGKQSDFVRARLKDGATVEQLKKIINNMTLKWLGTDQARFLRPQTLFAPLHFEDYLDQPVGGGDTNEPEWMRAARERKRQKEGVSI